MRRAPLGPLLVVAFLAAAATGCGGPQPDTSACSPADDRLVAAAQERLNVDGSLRHGHVVRSEDSGRTLFSAELALEEDIWSTEGDILTWVVLDEQQPRLAAVDEGAREASAWPPADFTVADDDGVVTSRGCTLVRRGTLDLDQYDIDCPERGAARRACLDDKREELEEKLTREYDERRRG